MTSARCAPLWTPFWTPIWPPLWTPFWPPLPLAPPPSHFKACRFCILRSGRIVGGGVLNFFNTVPPWLESFTNCVHPCFICHQRKNVANEANRWLELPINDISLSRIMELSINTACAIRSISSIGCKALTWCFTSRVCHRIHEYQVECNRLALFSTEMAKISERCPALSRTALALIISSLRSSTLSQSFFKQFFSVVFYIINLFLEISLEDNKTISLKYSNIVRYL